MGRVRTEEPLTVRVRSLGQEDPLEEGLTTHSNVLAWIITWMKEPGRLHSTGSQSQTQLKGLCRRTHTPDSRALTLNHEAGCSLFLYKTKTTIPSSWAVLHLTIHRSFHNGQCDCSLGQFLASLLGH